MNGFVLIDSGLSFVCHTLKRLYTWRVRASPRGHKTERQFGEFFTLQCVESQRLNSPLIELLGLFVLHL